jgi:hypothetical protein
MLSRFCYVSLLFLGTPSFAQSAPTPSTPRDTKPANAETEAQQSSPPSQPDEPTDKFIFVFGTKPRGAVVGDTPPVRTLNPSAIAAYGAEDVGELIEALGGQVTSNRGQAPAPPIVLVNGKRVSGFAEVANIPTEAIERTEIFTEELALKYGYAANQKVVNIVTFEFYNQKRARFLFATPSEGGRNTIGFNPSYMLIRKDTRFVANVDYSQSSALTERERGIVQSPENIGQGTFRTLLPKSRRLAINATVSGNIFGGTAYSLNGGFSTAMGETLFGLGAVGPLQQTSRDRAARIEFSLNGQQGTWRWFSTGGYDVTRNKTNTSGSNADRAFDISQFRNTITSANFGQSGAFLALPAGPVFVSLNQSVARRALKSSASNGAGSPLFLAQNQVAISSNFDVPIARSNTSTPAWLGNLSLNATLKVERFSKYGTLVSSGYGLDWRPVNAVQFSASFANQANAPDLSLRGLPRIVTANVPVFDYRSGKSENVIQVFGGNPLLLADKRRFVSLSGTVRPFGKKAFTLSTDYIRTQTDNPVGTFPVATPVFEAAFPARFTRDSAGRLIRIDNRPLNFARSQQSQVRIGLSWSRNLGRAGDDRDAEFFSLPPGVDPATFLQSKFPKGSKITIQTVEQGSPEADELADANNRVFLSIYHTWRLQDLVFLKRAGPALDVLRVGASDGFGALSRHEIDIRAGIFKRGLGTNLSLKWQSAAYLQAGSTNAEALRFTYRPFVGFNFFYNLGDRLGPKSPKVLRGMRLSLSVKNLLNARTRVRDGLGLTPLSYQPAILDPEGQVVSISVRKSF